MVNEKQIGILTYLKTIDLNFWFLLYDVNKMYDHSVKYFINKFKVF